MRLVLASSFPDSPLHMTKTAPQGAYVAETRPMPATGKPLTAYLAFSRSRKRNARSSPSALALATPSGPSSTTRARRTSISDGGWESRRERDWKLIEWASVVQREVCCADAQWTSRSRRIWTSHWAKRLSSATRDLFEVKPPRNLTATLRSSHEKT
jgi:hypothetical protein